MNAVRKSLESKIDEMALVERSRLHVLDRRMKLTTDEMTPDVDEKA